MRQNGEKMSENNDTINNQEEEYEKICYICRRPESKAGKMIAMPGNVYVCQDCLQKTFDTINNSGMNYDDMMKNIPGMGNIPGMNGFMSGDMNDNISQKQKIKKKNNKDEKDKEGNYIRKERYSGSCQRSFYVGEGVKQEDLKAAFNNGILTVAVPKEVQKPVEEKQYITIE